MEWKRRRLQTPAANGGGWIDPDKREALYRRDGRRCWYCGAAEGEEQPNGDPVVLTLDHKSPPSRYRGKHTPNHPTNLITACLCCNSSKGGRTMPEYVRAIGQPELNLQIRNHLRNSWETHLADVRRERELARTLEAVRRGEIAGHPEVQQVLDTWLQQALADAVPELQAAQQDLEAAVQVRLQQLLDAGLVVWAGTEDEPPDLGEPIPF